MPSPTLRDLCLEQIVASADRFLDLQWRDGRFELTSECGAGTWNQYHQQYILPAALLYTLEHAANPWRGDERLRAAIVRGGRHIASRVGDDGTMTWELNGQRFPFVCQRLLCALLLAGDLLEGYLPEAEEQAWEGAITRGCQWIWQRHILPHRDTLRFTAHDEGVGTGTNHFALYLSLLYRAGRRFGVPEWTETASHVMRRLAAAQSPGGYWPEHCGPALGYNTLTCHGVDQYAAWSGDEGVLPALRAAMDLHRHWTYPDGTPVECVDGRMRHLSQPMLWGLAAFSRWPEGRGYVRALLEQTRGTLLGGEGVANLAEAYLRLHEGDEEPAPQRLDAYRGVLDGVSVVRKQGPWVTALSGHCSQPWPDNVYMLDRQALVSVWRQGSGLVLDGSNSKRQPELATLCRGSGSRADALPLEAALLPGGREDTMWVRYATFDALVSVQIADPHTVDLSLRAPYGTGPDRVVATLVPAAAYGETVTLDFWGAKQQRRLGDEAFSVQMPEYGSVLAYRDVRVLLPGGTRVEYPVSPFNSYSADNTSPPSANRLVLRCPVSRGGIAFRVQAGR